MIERAQPQAAYAHETGSAFILRALSLSFGAAIAPGIARFSYALLLPTMKADLGWTYAQAGALNTSNAVGYLIGALVFPLLARRLTVAQLFLGGCVTTSLSMAAAGFTFDFDLLLLLRLVCGIFSAWIFVAGGVLATRLAMANPLHSGLVLGLFYSGAGWGIAISALVVPWSLRAAGHGWQFSWIALAVACALCSAVAWPGTATRGSGAAANATSSSIDATRPVSMTRFAPLLAAYGLFGIGYIGYMTFVIALLKAAGLGALATTGFYVVLGLAAAASGKVWSGLMGRARGGGGFALLAFLPGLATLVPALTSSPIAAFASGIVFGGTFPSVVTATTSFVRHNLPPARWSFGISVFTIVFALGQIIGPIAIGRISDGTSLAQGFLYSSIVLLVSAAIALAQRSTAVGAAPKH